TGVGIYTNGAWLGNASPTNSVYQFLWQDVQPGTNSITAVATNSGGATASATVANIIINAMPVVTIVNPINLPSLQTNWEGTNFPLSAYAYDPDGFVTNVQFFS